MTADNMTYERLPRTVLPPEPPVGSVIIDAKRMVRQRIVSDSTVDRWRSPVESILAWGRTWTQVCTDGDVLVVYRPDGDLRRVPGARTLARALLDAIEHAGSRPSADADILTAAAELRACLDGATE